MEEEEPKTSMRTVAVVALKRGVLLYWSLWFTVILATSVVHSLKALGILSGGWRFAFGDYKLISAWTWIYGAPAGVHGFFLAALVVCEAAIMVLFWRAFSKFHGLKNADRRSLAAAFILALSLFATFLVVDQVSAAYLYEGSHVRVFVAQIASMLGIYLLPE